MPAEEHGKNLLLQSEIFGLMRALGSKEDVTLSHLNQDLKEQSF